MVVRSTRHKTVPPTVHSLGYEGRDLVELLLAVSLLSVDVVVDVRLNAISRKKGFSKTE